MHTGSFAQNFINHVIKSINGLCFRCIQAKEKMAINIVHRSAFHSEKRVILVQGPC